MKADQAVAFAAFNEAIKGADVLSEWRAVNSFHDTAPVGAPYCADLTVVGQADSDTTSTMPKDAGVREPEL